MIHMECEICGKPVSDNPKRTKIDGSVMIVCDECAKFVRIQKAPPKSKFIKTNKKGKKQQNTKKRNTREEPTEELIENYNTTIRNKRESKNWSREQLGQAINEKVSVITRIESGKMIPDIKLTKKLEKALDLTLLEKTGEIDLTQFQGSDSGKLTLGSIVKIKKK